VDIRNIQHIFYTKNLAYRTGLPRVVRVWKGNFSHDELKRKRFFKGLKTLAVSPEYPRFTVGRFTAYCNTFGGFHGEFRPPPKKSRWQSFHRNSPSKFHGQFPIVKVPVVSFSLYNYCKMTVKYCDSEKSPVKSTTGIFFFTVSTVAGIFLLWK